MARIVAERDAAVLTLDQSRHVVWYLEGLFAASERHLSKLFKPDTLQLPVEKGLGLEQPERRAFPKGGVRCSSLSGHLLQVTPDLLDPFRR